MNILKLNVAIFSSLIFLLFAVVGTAAGGDYADGQTTRREMALGLCDMQHVSAKDLGKIAVIIPCPWEYDYN